MDATKRKQLEARGWRFGTASEFLRLTPADEAYIEMKLTLSKAVERKRKACHLTQKQLAKLMGSSQPRVAMMERGDQSVSLDLLARGLLALGVKPRRLAAIL